jgi:hypothetical protein
MIAWLNPVALVGLIALAGPLVVHLLRMRRAPRLLFPSLRFVEPGRSVASRLARIDDPWLLALRMAILAAAAFALAQPVLQLPARVKGWNARTARAIVLDTSQSMRLFGAEQAAADAVNAESESAFASRRIDTPDLDEGVRRAIGWLHSVPPARREIVIVSDLQAGSVSPSLASAVPAAIGVRFVRVGTPPSTHRFTGLTLAGTGGTQAVEITPRETTVRITEGLADDEGLRVLVAPGRERERDGLLRAVIAAGAPAPSAERPIAIVVGDNAAPAQPRAIGRNWMRVAAARIAGDPDVRGAARQEEPAAADADGAWTVLAQSDDGAPVVRAAAAGDSLVVRVAADPGSFLAAAVVRAALAGQADPHSAEQEIAATPPENIAAWSRDPAPVGTDAVRLVERTDGRWFWVAALLLLGAEAVVRRRAASEREAAHADAA